MICLHFLEGRGHGLFAAGAGEAASQTGEEERLTVHTSSKDGACELFLTSSSLLSALLLQTQRKVASARSDYERVHHRLMQELPQLYEGRVEFFEPCVTATQQSAVWLSLSSLSPSSFSTTLLLSSCYTTRSVLTLSRRQSPC